MTGLHALLARLEGATGPDRELDREVFLATVPGYRAWALGSLLVVPAHEPDHWGFTAEQQAAYREAWKAAPRPLPEGWEAAACAKFGTPWFSADREPLSLYDGRFASSSKNVSRQGVASLTASLDASLLLVERVLPGWLLTLWQYIDSDWTARLSRASPNGCVEADAKTPALALLIATVRALIARDEPGLADVNLASQSQPSGVLPSEDTGHQSQQQDGEGS